MPYLFNAIDTKRPYSVAFCLSSFALCLTFGQPGLARSSPHYTVTDLGILTGPKSEALGINDRGEIVGDADINVKDNTGTYITHAFLWHRGRLRDLGTLGGKGSKATGINNHRQIVGTSDIRGRFEYSFYTWNTHTFVWQHGSMRDLGVSNFVAINNRGEIVTDGSKGGLMLFQHRRRHSFRIPLAFNNAYAPNTGVHYWDGGAAAAINDRGSMTIDTSFSGDEGSYIRFPNGKLWLIVAGTANSIFGINQAGKAVGDIDGVAFLWNKGKIRKLGRLNHELSEAFGINDHDEVVGDVSDVGGNSASGLLYQAAFYWQKGKMHNLNKCIGENRGWKLQTARAINNRGQIVGTGLHNGKTRGFLLTPTTK